MDEGVLFPCLYGPRSFAAQMVDDVYNVGAVVVDDGLHTDMNGETGASPTRPGTTVNHGRGGMLRQVGLDGHEEPDNRTRKFRHALERPTREPEMVHLPT